MKRWGFKGQPASHGQTKTHRRPGASGPGGVRYELIHKPPRPHMSGLLLFIRYFKHLWYSSPSRIRPKFSKERRCLAGWATRTSRLTDWRWAPIQTRAISAFSLFVLRSFINPILSNLLCFRISAFQVWRVNTKYNVLYVHGTVPGHRNCVLKVKQNKITHTCAHSRVWSQRLAPACLEIWLRRVTLHLWNTVTSARWCNLSSLTLCWISSMHAWPCVCWCTCIYFSWDGKWKRVA